MLPATTVSPPSPPGRGPSWVAAYHTPHQFHEEDAGELVHVTEIRERLPPMYNPSWGSSERFSNQSPSEAVQNQTM
jgi:hypothetical protein